MLLVSKYPYQPLSRLQTNEGRKYVTPSGSKVPSVTTILDATADKTHLHEWRKRVGDVTAAQEATAAAGIGTKLHSSLENYILGNDYSITGTNLSHTIAKRMVNVMISKGLVNVNEVWGVEVALCAEQLYAGTADCIGLYNNVPSIIDFKNSKKIKKREWITDYFLQGIFYAEAHNQMFGTTINQVVILMVDREGNFAEFILSGPEYESYKIKAMLRLAQYYNVSIE